MLCKLCQGLGSRFCIQNGSKEWWICQACDGVGTRIVLSPANIRMHKIKKIKSPKAKF